MFINKQEINDLLNEAKNLSSMEIEVILAKALKYEEISTFEIASLLAVEDPKIIEKMLETAGEIKTGLYYLPLYTLVIIV
ncbi:MAG: hypothetical protein JJV90_01405 [Spiroplasma sp.]|nr:hypothetical protein [Mycoplasmatales bacterium]